MTLKTITILMPGDMGHAIGRVLNEHGHTIVTCLAGRSSHTRTLAQNAGFLDTASLSDAVDQADLILSILPPASAIDQAKLVAREIENSGKRRTYVDCNAVSPRTARDIATIIESAGGQFIDASIIGSAPGRGAQPRLYVSGPDQALLFDLDGKGLSVKSAGPAIGDASAIKMAYAGLTKGMMTLHTAVLLAASKLGVQDILFEEFEHSQSAALDAMRSSVPFLPADSARWVGEMEEIAHAFSDVGVTPNFHQGAAAIFHFLAKTPFADETRHTMDRTRTLEDALAVYKSLLPKTAEE